MNPLIIETDLGRDPDDFFAICYLIGAGIKIEAMFITPGDPDQIAIGKFLSKHLKQNFPVMASHENRNKKSSVGIYYQILNKYQYPLLESADNQEIDLNNKDIFIIGPPTKIGTMLEGKTIGNITVQGGFIGYDVHGLPTIKLDKFIGKQTVSTFNLGGAISQSHNIINHKNCKNKRFVSKNLCHTIIYNDHINDLIMSYKTKNPAIKLLREGMNLYLKNHKAGKKFHDPTAAVCHLHPQIATWVKAKLYSEKNQWGAKLDENGDDIIVDIDRDKLWEYIATGT